MDIEKLFKGIAIVIDDQIEEKGANIINLISQIKRKNIPILCYPKIPTADVISNFQGVSFILLDWRLNEHARELAVEGVMLPAEIEKYDANENIEFLKGIKKICFCPIFIFSNESKESIYDSLEAADICQRDVMSNIFVKGKTELIGRSKLFTEINKWIKKNPSIYVLKEWENEYQSSKNRLFSDFQALSPQWAKLMWDNFSEDGSSEDGSSESFELGELISKNLHTRMTPFDFSGANFPKRKSKFGSSELKKVLEGERFLKNELLHDEVISTGDIFKVQRDNTEDDPRYTYFINIRAQCDITRRDRNPVLYLLKGRVIDVVSSNKKKTNFSEGQFIEKINQAIIPFLDDGKVIEFLFKDIKLEKWNSIKSKRIGRLLPPYINRMQQRYALYSQRQGLPRTPFNAFSHE